jgi:hypothetical protein
VGSRIASGTNWRLPPPRPPRTWPERRRCVTGDRHHFQTGERYAQTHSVRRPPVRPVVRRLSSHSWRHGRGVRADPGEPRRAGGLSLSVVLSVRAPAEPGRPEGGLYSLRPRAGEPLAGDSPRRLTPVHKRAGPSPTPAAFLSLWRLCV